MAIYYLSNFGNDNNDGLSWKTSKRTFQGVVDLGGSNHTVYVTGWFNELNIPGNTNNWYGVNYAKISGLPVGGQLGDGNFYNFIFEKIAVAKPSPNGIRKNCKFYNPVEGYSYNYSILENCLIVSSNDCSINSTSNATEPKRLTLVSTNINKVLTLNSYGSGNWQESINSIIANWSILIRNIGCYFKYSLYTNCKFRFIGGGLGNDESTYEYPTGANDEERILNLKSRMAIVYGGVASDYLDGCKYHSGPLNEIFVDPDNQDYHLKPNCTAAHMSYDGDYIGALPEGKKADWNADFQNIINIDAYGNIINQNIDASANTTIQDIGHIRKIKSFNALGNLAKRNGQSLNTESDLGADILAGANVLTIGAVYQCHNDTVTINSNPSKTLIPFECYTAADGGNGEGLGFTGDGVLKEVLTDNYQTKLQFKFSKDDPTLASANIITCYLSRDTDYVMINVDGTGKPLYGDADDNYDEVTAVALSARYWQAYVTIKANNLAAR